MNPGSLVRVSCLVPVLAPGATGLADSVSLTPVQDSTVYEYVDGLPDQANGAGAYLFAGKNAGNQARRALIRFDMSAIPSGSTITSATLRVNVSRTHGLRATIALHRATASWGEGPSDPGGEEGGGVVAGPGDATWRHRFFPGTFWSTVGGDFDATPAATVDAVGLGPLTWDSTPTLVTDVQRWLDDPQSNFGWVVIGDESAAATAYRFDSRESVTPALAPTLAIGFTPPPRNCDFTEDGAVDFSDVFLLIDIVGGLISCPAGFDCDLDQNGSVDFGDVFYLIDVVGGLIPC